MTLRRLRLRLWNSGRRVRDLAYARLAALCVCTVRPCAEAGAERLFCDLIDGEAAEGRSLEAILGHLPLELALAIRCEFAVLLATEGAGVEPEPGAR